MYVFMFILYILPIKCIKIYTYVHKLCICIIYINKLELVKRVMVEKSVFCLIENIKEQKKMRFFLREVTLEDGKNIVNWRNNRNVITHCIDETLITEEYNECFYHEYVETGRVKQFIIERSDEEWGAFWVSDRNNIS